nr:hypothetical protein [uncultured Porphyromonas sp.]
MHLQFYPDQFNLKDETLLLGAFDFIAQTLSQGCPMRDETIHIIAKDDSPMCARINDDNCIIFLHCPSDASGLQYAYQFAHEFCHWLIGGSLSGELCGLFWLEETVCELASFHCLSVLRDKWTQLAPSYPLPHVDDYILRMLSDGLPPAPIPLRGYIARHREELYTPAYHRDLYSRMALALHPHFLGTPELWTLLPYFGDLKSYYDPVDWLSALRLRTPPAFARHCSHLESLLLGSRH